MIELRDDKGNYIILEGHDAKLIIEALTIGSDSLKDYASNFSSVDAEIDGGNTYSDAHTMSNLAELIQKTFKIENIN